MSRYFNSFMDDYSEALEHSWGTSPEAKAREKEYNHWYYQKHKAEIEAVRKQKSAARNSYKQAEKSNDDASRYESLADKMYYKNPESYKKYTKMYEESKAKSRELSNQANQMNFWAIAEADRILRGVKNPTVRDLVEFYLDTTIAKAKKSASKAANKAKKYATKAVSNAEKEVKKYATKAANKAEKYATKAVSNAEKAANKAEKYATKAVKSVANKAKKYVVR